MTDLQKGPELAIRLSSILPKRNKEQKQIIGTLKTTSVVFELTGKKHYHKKKFTTLQKVQQKIPCHFIKKKIIDIREQTS